MNGKRITGIVLLIVGVGLIAIAGYIQTEVVEGRHKIKDAEETVDTSRRIFSVHPVTKDVSEPFLKGADKKIAEGKRDVAYYAKLSNQLRMTGIALTILGVLFIIFGRKKKR